MTRADASLIGALLDRRYRVDRLLARGGMSSVYRGVDTRLDRAVAIKIMDPRFADDRAFVERFEREARSAAKLHHPHVVAVHDQGVDHNVSAEHDRAFLVMELVEGGTLRDLIDERGALEPELALSVLDPVLSALAAAHEAGLVHRDVKPENVLIGRGGPAGGGAVKVADFGLVRAVASAGTTSSSVILGTVAYLSPEQVTTGSASESGDVYSAGILLYEMLTGQAPYTGDTLLSVAYRHVNDDVPAPSRAIPAIPAAIDDLVLQATRRDPRARPADAGAFLAELRAARDGLGIAPVPVPIPPVPTGPTPTAGPSAPPIPPAPPAPAGPDTGAGQIPDNERTMPAIAMPTVPAMQPAGPRGTMALNRPAADTSAHAPATATPAAGARPPEGPPTPWFKRWPALWITLALVVLAGAGVGVWALSGPASVPVPNVSGSEQAAAEKLLRDAKLTPVPTQERHNTVPAGTVIRTDPTADTEATEGDSVSVVISSGQPVVPDVAAGAEPGAAEQAIRDAQLTPVRDQPGEYSAEVPAGAVLRLDPQPGSTANIDDPVSIVLSNGPPPLPVPDVAGRSQQEAFQALQEAGLEPFEAGQEFSPDVPAGAVIRTDPAGGGTVDSTNNRIGVYVSNAVEVPMLLGNSTRDAVAALEAAGLQPEAPEGSTEGFSFVVGQDPQPGTRVEAGSTVRLNTIP